MQEMIEPDRTIMIVSIIGLVIIWGSVAYRKFAQKGESPALESAQRETLSDGSTDTPAEGSASKQQGAPSNKRRKNR